MRELKSTPLYNLLKSNKILPEVVQDQLILCNKINLLLKEILPEPLRHHCHAARVNPAQRELVLATDSPSWNASLRFQLPAIASQLARRGWDLPNCRIQVLLPQDTARRPRRSAQGSEATAQVLRQSAEDTQDPQLKRALLRLSRTLSRK